MAALLTPEMNSRFSSFQFAELSHSSCEGSPPAIAGAASAAAAAAGPSDFDAFDFAQTDKSQFFYGELGAPTFGMIEGGDLYECEMMEYEEVKRRKVEAGCRIGFRTRSEVEILDDGFKWRKYGKKAVKNSPNPRNYYRCSTTGCDVKKRVERDRNDANYVITIYEGTHNHISPADYRPYSTINSPRFTSAPNRSWNQRSETFSST